MTRQRAAKLVGYVYAAIGSALVAWDAGWATWIGVVLLIAAHVGESHGE